MNSGYYNDYMNRNIVLIIFFTFYGYLSYNHNQLKRQKNWSSVTCNPLELIISSIFDYDNSNKQFEKCMQYSVSSDQEKRIQDYSKELNKDLQMNINNLNTKSTNEMKITDDILKKTADEISAFEKNNLYEESTINDLKIKVQQLTERINTSLDTFRDPSNNLISNLAL